MTEKKQQIAKQTATMKQPKTFVTIGLIIWSIGISLFALLPLLPAPNPLLLIEIIIGVLGAMGGVLLTMNLLNKWVRWLSSYAYAYIGAASLLTFLGFSVGETSAPVAFRVTLAIMLFAGAVLSYGAHLEWGGHRGR